MSQCKIYLENYGGTYYAGSDIRGRLECYFDDETTVRGIKIRAKCKEHNSWMSSESYYDHHDKRYKTRWVNFTGETEVMRYEQMLFGSVSDSRKMNRGRHVYPFHITLPDNIPSSFNGPYGGIDYYIKGIVDRPMRMDYEDRFSFCVQSVVDLTGLSDDHYCTNNYSDEKTVCCFCCKGGNITMDVELPKIAFMPGETVNFKVNITNLSNESVERLKVDFEKEITYRVTSPSRESKDENVNIVSISEHGVGAHGEHTYELQMLIPDYIDVPNFSLCSLFESRYLLKVVAEMGACTANLDIHVYPEMGHILRNQPSGQWHQEPGFIAPPVNGTYPPPPGAPYPPEPYPPGPGGAPYPAAPYPPAPGAGVAPYPPAPGPSYPPPPGGHPPSYGVAAGTSDKAVFPGGVPTAPTSFGGSAPPMLGMPGTHSREKGGAGPSAPAESPTEPPPPSYNDVLKSNPPYPPN